MSILSPQLSESRGCLPEKIGSPRSKYLVYTSAGDKANLHCWLKGYRNFDLWITYYGNQRNRYKDIADFYNVRKDAKFPNLRYVYQQWKNILNSYQAVFVLDDDLIFKGSSISRLFEIREQYDLWLLQPAFDPRGKISWPITRVQPRNFLRYTNYVEVGCPLFRKDKLDDFMKIYDPVLVGFGIDWWFLDVLGPNKKGRIAVIDAISCINPFNIAKGGQSEIDRFQKYSTRVANWEEIERQHGIQSKAEGFKEFGSARTPLSVRNYVRILFFYSMSTIMRFMHMCYKGLRKIQGTYPNAAPHA